MRLLFSTIATTLFVIGTLPSGFVLAASSNTNLKSDNLARLVHVCEKTGNVYQTMMGTFRSLEWLAPTDTASPHALEYFSVIGDVNSKGAFVTSEITSSMEIWVLKDNKWKIDDWTYLATPEGSLIQVNHDEYVESLAREVLIHRRLPTPPITDPSIVKQWLAAISVWSNRTLNSASKQ